MNISISNVIINYFLTHNDRNLLTKQDLQKLVKKIKQELLVNIEDYTVQGIKASVDIFSDFLQLDKDNNIIQKNIMDYLDDLQPVYEYLGLGQWSKQYEYYKLLRQF